MQLSLVISALTAGGAERVLCTLAGAWAQAGHRVEILTTHDGGGAPHFPLPASVRVRSVDPRTSGPVKQARLLRKLRAAIRQSRPDVVISFLNYTNILTLIACHGLPCPVVVSERLDPRVVGIGPVWSLLRKLSYRHCARLVAQTPTAASLFESLAPGRVRVIPNPVQPLPDAGADQAPAQDGHNPMILAVGRLQPQKGFDLAIRALAMLPSDLASWRLTILGEGPQRAALEKLRDDLGLGERVLLPGRVAEPAAWYRRAEVFLLSSRSEGFPNVLCEAMAAGRPVVATDCPSGPADIVTDGVDGILVPAEDPSAIAVALTTLITSPPLRERLAAAAPRVVERYALSTVLAAWDQVLAEACHLAATPAQAGAKPRIG